jgi:hypothetical protein
MSTSGGNAVSMKKSRISSSSRPLSSFRGCRQRHRVLPDVANCERVAAFPRGNGIEARGYHARLTPEERIAQEAAVLASKADVREEIDRLNSHVAQARELIADGGAVGRRLDFLSQEFNREANTLCSKAGDIELTRIGLDLKAVIEQFREQVQNVE